MIGKGNLMRMVEIEYENGVPIDGYGPGFFRIAGERVDTHLLLTPKDCVAWSGFDDLDGIVEAKGDFDVLFLGMGADIAHPPEHAQQVLRDASVAFEAMGTGAACRTYNVLLSEGRRVAAALLTV